MEQQLIDAIRDLEKTIALMNGNLGRGINNAGAGNRGGRGGRPGGSSGSTGNPLDDVAKKISKNGEKLNQVMIDQIAAARAAGRSLTKEQKEFEKSLGISNKAIDESTKATKDRTQADNEAKWKAEELARANKNAIKSTGEFAKEMLLGRGTLGQALGGLQGGLEMAGKAGNRFAAFAGMLVGALSFTLTTMQEFAKNAQGVAGAIDLRAMRAGFYTSRMLYSGLGEHFSKVINESENSFKFFGRTTEEAVDRLADLSRGLKSGSGQLSRSLRKELGADTVKAFDRAASAAAAMAMTDEERASLEASIMTQVRFQAKNEEDARRMLVEQFSRTVVSARELSNTFGISSKALLKAIENFNRSTSGRTLARRGLGAEAQGMIASVESLFGDSLSQDQKERISGALAQGRTGDAVAVEGLNAAQRQSIMALGSAREQATQMQGGANAENLAKALQEQGNLQRIAGAYEGVREGIDNTGISRTREDINRFLSNLDPRVRQQAARDAEANRQAGTTTEARNIESLNKLETAINSLKGAVSSLITAIYAVGGPLALIATALTGAALMKMLGGGMTAGGLFKSALEKIGIGGGAMPDAGARRRTRIGGGRGGPGGRGGAGSGAGGGAGGGVMDKIGSGIGSVGEGLGKGIAGIAGGIGEGLAKLLPAIGQGIAGFISAFGNPAVLKGALILAGVVAVVGGGIALALAAMGLGLKAFAWGLKDINEIDGDKLSQVSTGLKDLTTGVLAFSLAAGANIMGSLVNGIASLFGADITTRIKRAVEDLAPIAPMLSIIGPSMKAFGEGLKFFGEAFTSLKGVSAREMQSIFAVIRDSGLGNLAPLGIGIQSFGQGLKYFGEAFVSLKGVGAESMHRIFSVIRESGLNNLASMGQGMLNFGTGLKSFAEALKLINVDQLQRVMESLRTITPDDIRRFQGIAQSPMGVNPRSLAQPLQTGLNPTQQVSQLLTPTDTVNSQVQQLAQNNPLGQEDSPASRAILSILSNIATDINAIRGNTRPDSGVSPVRLG